MGIFVRSRLLFGGLFCLCLLTSVKCTAQAGIVFAAAPNTTCVMQTDNLWITVFSPIVSPYHDWLAQGRTGGFLVTPTIASQGKGTNSFPQLQQVGIMAYKDNRRVILPLLMTPIRRLDLDPDDDSQVIGIDLDVKYIEQKKTTTWGSALQTLSTLVTKLPIPPGPYSAAAQQVSSLTSSLVNNSLATENLESLPAKFHLSLNIGTGTVPGQRCPAFAEMGTYAVVDPSPATNGAETGDYIDVYRTGDYCFYAENLGGQTVDVKWQTRDHLDNDGKCVGKGDIHSLANNYVPMVVTSAPKQAPAPPVAGLPLGLTVKNGRVQDVPERELDARTASALKVCATMNISRAECLTSTTEVAPELHRQLQSYDLKFKNQLMLKQKLNLEKLEKEKQIQKR